MATKRAPKSAPKVPANVPHMHVAASGETVVRGPAAMLAPGIVTVTLPSGIQAPVVVHRVGKVFPRNGVDTAYGYLTPLPAQAPFCRVCKGPHRPHQSKGVAAPLPVPDASRVA